MSFIIGLLVIFIIYVLKFKEDFNKENSESLVGTVGILIGIIVVVNIITIFL